MDAIRQWLLCLCAAGLLCGIVCEITKATACYRLIRWICALVLLLTLLGGYDTFSQISWQSLLSLDDLYGEELVTRGSMDAQSAMHKDISARTGTYIMDIAQSMGIDARVEVVLSGDTLPVPIGVRIYAQLTPYQKLRLEEWIHENLNVPKENLVWIG